MKHCNTNKRFILLLDRPRGSQIVAKLYDGAWIGVMEDNGDWMRVITTDGYGWIQTIQSGAGSRFQFRFLPGSGGSHSSLSN